MNTIYQKNLESVTHIAEMELNLFMYFLHQSHTQEAHHFNFVRRSGGFVVEEKLYVLNISQSESGPS